MNKGSYRSSLAFYSCKGEQRPICENCLCRCWLISLTCKRVLNTLDVTWPALDGWQMLMTTKFYRFATARLVNKLHVRWPIEDGWQTSVTTRNSFVHLPQPENWLQFKQVLGVNQNMWGNSSTSLNNLAQNSSQWMCRLKKSNKNTRTGYQHCWNKPYAWKSEHSMPTLCKVYRCLHWIYQHHHTHR